MQADEWQRCRSRADTLREYFQNSQLEFTVGLDLDFAPERGASFRFDPRSSGQNFPLVRVDLEILKDYDADNIIRLIERAGWRSLIMKVPLDGCLRFSQLGIGLTSAIESISRPTHKA